MATDSNWYTEGFLNSDVDNPVMDSEGYGELTDPLALDIDDSDLVDIIDQKIDAEQRFYKNKYDLYARRSRNETYLFGRQVKELEDEGKLKDYEAKNLDNVLYEIEATIKPLAMSQLPDLIVTPGNNTDQSKQVAELLTKAVDSDMKKRQNRKVLAMAFKHLPVYFIGVVKVRWDPQLAGGLGDYVFEYVHPSTIDFDHTATEADADKMDWVSQLAHSTVEKVLMQFPKAKEAFLKELRIQGVMAKDQEHPTWKNLATPIDYREVWFTDYEKSGDGKWERVEGVCWKYEGCILGKMKNPWFDYEGNKQVFTYDDPQLASTKRALSQEEMQASLMMGVFPEHVNEETVYNNYFDMPRKPYFFMTYDQWGKQPLDETSRVEQNIKNQDTLDKRGKQIEETLNNRGHHIWSKLGGFKPADIQKMDHNNPDEDYLVDGIPQQVHEFIAPDRPTPAEYKDKQDTRDRMYAVSGSTAIRGQIESNVATTNQIAREANYTRADDLVEDTINPASEWMAGWALQMIKTRYTQEHFRKMLGKKGEVIFYSLHQNMIEDGMEVMIKSSGTDKIKKQNNAMEMAKMQLIDPLTFYQDMQLDDPEGRAAKIITFKTDMPLYLSEFVDKGPTSTGELVAKLAAITQQQQMMGQQQQQPNGAPAPQGQPQQNPSPANTAQIPAQPPVGPAQGSVRTM